MKNYFLICFLFACWAPNLLAGYTDGFITAGEYEYAVTWRSFNPPLIVNGGGADEISVRDNGRLIVQSTSKPLSLYSPVGGVYDILLYNTSHLLYTGGLTELITIGGNGTINATAELRGGSINLIKSMQFTEKTGSGPHIDLYCQSGWSWINNDPLVGIQGKWLDGSSFNIEFINHADFDPAWTNINVIPEPTTLLLLGLGGLLVQRKKPEIEKGKRK